MTEEQQRAALALQIQQEVIFDSMVEGLLLLDERGRVQLANRAFTSPVSYTHLTLPTNREV